MSAQMGKLCSVLLLEYFGETVEKVGMDLFRGGQKPLRLICITTKLQLNEVRQALCLLIKYGLVTFHPSKVLSIPEYRLHCEKVVLFLRYPKYLMLIKNLYGNEAEIIIEEILRHGRDTASCILYRTYQRILTFETGSIIETELERIKNVFEMLINKQYILRSPRLGDNKMVPELLDDPGEFQFYKMNMSALNEALNKNIEPSYKQDNVFWEINFNRFHQDMRDDLLVLATARRINPTAGEILRLVLQQMDLKLNSWAPTSNPILISDIKDLCTRSKADSNLLKNLEDYLSVMKWKIKVQFCASAVDVGGFLKKSQIISSAYEMKLNLALIELTWCVLSNGVDAKFGSNAARIFRLIREQGFIEQDEIQKKAMLPDKEAKLLTYSLLQSGWIQQHELKKGFQKAGPTKTFYLFYIDFDQVVRMYMETCYKSLYNSVTLREQEKLENRCLLEKKQRIDAIILHMRKEGATNEQVAEIEEMVTPPEHALLEKIHLNINKVTQAELQIDETLFILQLCISLKNI